MGLIRSGAVTRLEADLARGCAKRLPVSWRARNQTPRRYVWKAKSEDILRKINTARQALAAATPDSNDLQIHHTSRKEMSNERHLVSECCDFVCCCRLNPPTQPAVSKVRPWAPSQDTWFTIHFSVCLVAAPGECMYTIYTQSGRKRIPTVL